MPAQELPFGSVLIVLERDHSFGGLDLGSDPEGWPSPAEIVLEPSSPITVRVIDIRDNPQAAAIVHHQAKAREPDDGSVSSVAKYERFFAHESLTDADGLALLPPFRGEQAIWAEKDELLSSTWQGPLPSSTVILTLGGSFTVGGTITLPDWDPQYEGERRILVSGLTGNLWRPLVRLRDVQEGDWGPVRIPLDGVARYRLRLEGAPIVPVEHELAPPEASIHRRIDFAAEKLADLWLYVSDESKHPVPTANAVVWWGPSDMPTGPSHVEGAARNDGFLYVGTFPPGIVQFRVTAPGYALFEHSTQVPTDSVIGVTLKKGGRVSGRCTHAGKPVTDFDVLYWSDGSVRRYRNESFFGREDGNFEIKGLGAGDWSFFAASPMYPSGKPITIRVEADREEHVELELPTAIRGGGRVVDAESGVPLRNAGIQVYSSGGVARVFPWGAPVLAAADGTFELDAFVLGANFLTVEAEGYAGAEVQETATAQEYLDWGDIRLFRPQDLELSLLGVGELDGLRPTDIRAYTVEGPPLPERSFDERGVVRYDDIGSGDYRLLVFYPDESWTRLHLRLDPGKEWNFDLKVAGDRRLDVRVVDAKGGPLPFVPAVLVSAQEENGVFVVRVKAASNDGRARFEGLRAEQAQIWALGSDGKTLATRDVLLGSNPSLQVEVRVGDRPFRVRVVDGDGNPIPAAWVTIRSLRGAEIHAVDDTDADGWASLFGLPESQVLMDVGHGIAGKRFGVPVDPAAEEIEFVLEAKGTLELELRDGQEPLAGVVARIETTAGVTLSDAQQSDQDGLVRFERLGEGAYHVACRRADCWPAVVDRGLGADEHARMTVQMRRLTDLELMVFNAAGLPVTGVSLQIRSIEFDASIETWLRDKKIRAPGGLTTDERGKIRAEDLPRGDYTWTVPVDGQDLTGSFRLVAGLTNEVSVYLPR